MIPFVCETPSVSKPIEIGSRSCGGWGVGWGRHGVPFGLMKTFWGQTAGRVGCTTLMPLTINFMSCGFYHKKRQQPFISYLKGKVHYLDFIKIKIICSAKDSDENMKGQITDWRNYLQTT